MEYWSDGFMEPTTPTLQYSNLRGGFCYGYASLCCVSGSRSGYARRLLSSIPRHRRVRTIAGRGYFDYGWILQLDVFKRRPALGEMRMDLGLHHIGLEV